MGLAEQAETRSSEAIQLTLKGVLDGGGRVGAFEKVEANITLHFH